MKETQSKHFTIMSKSVIGSLHIQNNKCNQDSIKVWKSSSEDVQSCIVSIADGHGSKKSFRSKIGSQLAVHIVEQVLHSELLKKNHTFSLSYIKQMIEEKLPIKITSRWNETVKRHFQQTPFTMEELQTLSDDEKELLKSRPEIAYGTTLLSVIITESFVVYLQLGDGDIIVLTQDSELIRPIQKDSRLIANETTSLSSKKAWMEIQISFTTLVGKLPKMIFICTDGYSNSFISEMEFLQSVKDYNDILGHEGPSYIEDNIETWLNDISRNGSGDDTTVAIVYCS
ncbi:PP2C family serine/threonine-protein phosphatase [Caryophanon latum]|uniref:PPM-type phosphatase domain-containing protein n=1 Tax=Caryophanon latum TaxID=33977 RepID=A0A1C0YX49_9BACL|nr:PP2C family serine/threonine-protein phosphatase [Caryophanon latum]OCS91714.1 hypothetical protein A6K76_08260 [Caryophanon latum]